MKSQVRIVDLQKRDRNDRVGIYMGTAFLVAKISKGRPIFLAPRQKTAIIVDTPEGGQLTLPAERTDVASGIRLGEMVSVKRIKRIFQRERFIVQPRIR